MNRLDKQLTEKLNDRILTGNLRQLNSLRLPVDFFSNDYLGFATSGMLNLMIKERFANSGATGSTGSRLLSGNSAETEQLEQTIAAFHKAEGALLFNSGYDANMGLISSIAQRHTTIIYDELCHASIIDGVRLSLCSGKYKFSHNNLADLAGKLQRHNATGPTIVIVESVYSMDGDLAPLAELADLCSQYDAQLIVDEAHATGVFGNNGEGMVVMLGLQNKVFARVHTFGKALGCHGAVVVGSALLKQYLINFSRSFIYTTALPQHSVQAIDCAYSHLASQGFTNKPLHELIGYFNTRVTQANHQGWVNSTSPIQVLITGSNSTAVALATKMQAANLQIKAILSPTVPSGKERLRVCLHSYNTPVQIDRLFEVCG